MTVRATSNDIAALRKLCQGEPIKARMLRAASGQALALIQLGFRNQTDPNGNPWKPLKYRKGMILRKTARMANAFTSRPTARGFVAGNNVFYTGFQQDGTKYIDPRNMVPPNGQLTDMWQDKIDKACNDAMQKAVAEAGGK